jgi:hypothetical protein
MIGQTTDRYEVRTSLSGGNELCMSFALNRAAQPTDASAAG